MQYSLSLCLCFSNFISLCYLTSFALSVSKREWNFLQLIINWSRPNASVFFGSTFDGSCPGPIKIFASCQGSLDHSLTMLFSHVRCGVCISGTMAAIHLSQTASGQSFFFIHISFESHPAPHVLSPRLSFSVSWNVSTISLQKGASPSATWISAKLVLIQLMYFGSLNRSMLRFDVFPRYSTTCYISHLLYRYKETTQRKIHS